MTSSLFAQSETELVEICTEIAKDATYLKDFKALLDAGTPPPVQRFTVVLQKDTKYRFSICSSKDYPGEGILQVYDNNRLIATTYNVATGKSVPVIDLNCLKTGPYHIFIQFKDGKPGLAVGILSFVEKL
jgi:hypothetical protein